MLKPAMAQAATQLTVERIIEHHLAQNLEQKITPHLITGLTVLIAQNIRNAGIKINYPKQQAAEEQANG